MATGSGRPLGDPWVPPMPTHVCVCVYQSQFPLDLLGPVGMIMEGRLN
jgi:hypothetical protein